MDKRLMHYAFPRDQIQLDGTTAELPQKIAAVVEDTTEKAIVQAVIDAARAAEVTDLYLLDKKFILDAIREKQERESPKPQTNAARIRAMSDEELAAWIVETTYICACCSVNEGCQDAPHVSVCKKNVAEWLQQPAKEE